MPVNPSVLASWLREVDKNLRSGQIYVPVREEYLSLKPQIFLKETSNVRTIETWTPRTKTKVSPKDIWNDELSIDLSAHYGVDIYLSFFLDGVQKTSLYV